MNEETPKERLETLDSFFHSQQLGKGEVNESFLSMMEERYLAAEEFYGPHHPQTLNRFCDYAFLGVDIRSSRESLELFVDIRKRATEVFSPMHPINVRGILGTADVLFRDDEIRDASELLQEAAVKIARLHKRNRCDQETLWKFVMLSMQCRQMEHVLELMQKNPDSPLFSTERYFELLKRFIEAAIQCDELTESEMVAHQSFVKLALDMAALTDEDMESFQTALSQLIGSCMKADLAHLSESFLKKQLEILDREDQSSLKTITQAHADLSIIYQEAGEEDLAWEHYEEAVSLLQKCMPEQNCCPRTLQKVGELAYSHKHYVESKDLLRAALESGLQEGPENSETAELLHKVGTLCLADKEMAEAEVFLTNALQMKKRFFGEYTEETQLTLIALGHLYGTSARQPRADEMFLEALRIEEHLHGDETEMYRKIEGLREKLLKRRSSATDIQETELSIPEVGGFFKAGGEAGEDESADPKIDYRNALKYLQQGKFEPAVELLEQVLNDSDQTDDKLKSLALEQLADAYFSLGKDKEAKECLAALSV